MKSLSKSGDFELSYAFGHVGPSRTRSIVNFAARSGYVLIFTLPHPIRL